MSKESKNSSRHPRKRSTIGKQMHRRGDGDDPPFDPDYVVAYVYKDIMYGQEVLVRRFERRDKAEECPYRKVQSSGDQSFIKQITQAINNTGWYSLGGKM